MAGTTENTPPSTRLYTTETDGPTHSTNAKGRCMGPALAFNIKFLFIIIAFATPGYGQFTSIYSVLETKHGSYDIKGHFHRARREGDPALTIIWRVAETGRTGSFGLGNPWHRMIQSYVMAPETETRLTEILASEEIITGSDKISTNSDSVIVSRHFLTFAGGNQRRVVYVTDPATRTTIEAMLMIPDLKKLIEENKPNQ